MKVYSKVNSNISKKASNHMINSMGSSIGTLPELVALTRSFYRSASNDLFQLMVRQVWLEQKFTYGGVRRGGRSSNGFGLDWSYSFFIKQMVGISQKPLTNGAYFTSIPTYFKDFFPDFSEVNPFEEPEYFKFPYKHVTIDFLYFVYQHHERIEMLNYAEKHKMNISEFEDWAYNQAMCYNLDKGKEVYIINRHSFIPCLKLKKKTVWK